MLVLELLMSGPFLEGMWVKSVAVTAVHCVAKMLTWFLGVLVLNLSM